MYLSAREPKLPFEGRDRKPAPPITTDVPTTVPVMVVVAGTTNVKTVPPAPVARIQVPLTQL